MTAPEQDRPDWWEQGFDSLEQAENAWQCEAESRGEEAAEAKTHQTRVEHGDDWMSITTYNLAAQALREASQEAAVTGVPVVVARQRRHRRATRPSTDVQRRLAAEEADQDWLDTQRDLINWSYS